jgi:Holliday junction resolvasome RuvABC DNA-binding subunit
LNLGYRRKEAEKAVGRAVGDGEKGLEELIRNALSHLSRP